MSNSKKIAQTSIKKNYIYNTIYQVLSLITPLITAPYISRVLGSSGVGIYSYTNSIVTYFTLFAALGTASYGQREIAMHRNDSKASSKLFWEIEFLSITTTAVSLIIWLIWICVSTQYTAVYGVLTLSVLAVAFDISWYFGGFEKFKYIVIRNTVVKITGIALLFLFVKKETDILLYVCIMAATGLIGNISMWTYLPKLLSKVDFKTLHPFKVHLKQTFLYFIPTIATSVYTVLDKTMIGAITNSEELNGYYEQATKIIRMVESLLFSLNTVMVSRQSYLFAEGKTDEIKEKIDKSFEFLFALAVPFMFGIWGVAENFVPWFFGNGYKPVVMLLYLMSPLPLVICISNIMGSQYLTPSGQRARSSKGIIVGAITNFILNLILIHKFGANGATIASLAAECVISVVYVHMSKEFINWHQIWNALYKKLIAGFVMFLGVLFLGKGYQGNIIISMVQVVLGAVIYGIMLIVLKDKVIYDAYITQFAEFNRFTNSPVANYKGELYSLPFNMYTFNKMWGVVTPEEASVKIEEQRKEAGITEPKNLEEQAISLVGRDIYEKLIKGYTEKQWGRDCKDLPSFIIKRLPVRLTFDNNYFNALYQGIPVGGYTKMVANLLDGIEVRLNMDYLDNKAELDALADKVVYTGAIDAYFDYKLGTLEYRSVRFETETLDKPNFQGNAAVNYTDRETPWTRIIEHKWFEFGKDEDGNELPKTVISREFSSEWKTGDEPYYPVNDEKNGALYAEYKKLAGAEEKVIFGGRLGEYKYYDMDAVIASALDMCEKELQ